MHLYAEPLADDPGTIALFYGPMVLAADLGKEGLTSERINTTDNFYGGVKEPWQVKFEMPSLTGNPQKLNWIKKEKADMQFSTSRTSNGQFLLFRPLYQIYNCRFADYFKITR